MSEAALSKDPYDLFMGYLDVVNEALYEHEDTPVVGNLLSLMKKVGEGKKFGAAVYKSDPQEPFDYFTVRMNGGKVELDSRGKDDPDIDFRVAQDFLVEVNEHPEEYVSNPAKLDLAWIKSRLLS